ncbi:hypothetical protein [uncultured Roseobacter sp.]|uniref:hypothetical protein n=1 Tax=uncultured Roseobacter sp. TaxID=114847 RepID=UPI00260543BC|nr:hypothetical protein [uncultured Roseobacter sp.]
MKLVIHCGLHKTGTTSFQKFCFANRLLLRDFGVHYPEYGDQFQHSHVLWEVQRRGSEALGAYLQECFREAEPTCHTVLLSGEDFENCIADVALASEIEALAHEAGFDAISWVVVTRPIEDYISSLYAEKSKHGVVLSREVVQKAAKERGCLYLSTVNFNYIFIFDFERFAKRFRHHVSGQVIEYDFDSFMVDHPGVVLLRQLLSEDAFTQFQAAAEIGKRAENERLNYDQVEANYVATALGVERLKSNWFRPLAAPFIWLRLRKARILQNGSTKSG